jgi:hypothetical protein
MKKAMFSIALCALIVAGVACGGSDDDAASAESFAEQACVASTKWQDSLRTSLTNFQEAATGQSDAAVIKDGVLEAFNTFRTATEELIDTIAALEPPGDEGATEFKERYGSTLTSIKSSLDKLIDDVGGIPTDSDAVFKRELKDIASGFQQSLAGLGNPFTDIPEELLAKFEAEPSCSEVLGPAS